MQSPTNITQALDQLKHEIQNGLTNLNNKDRELLAIGNERQTLLNEIQRSENEIKQKEIELQKSKTELQQIKNKIPELDRNHRRLAEEVTKIRLENNKKSLDLTRIQREYSEAVKNMGKK